MKKKRDLAKPLRIFVGICFSTIIALTILQVFMRFVVNKPLTWSDSFSRFIFIWMTIVGAAALSYDNKHLKITSIIEQFPMSVQFIITCILRIIEVVFLVVTAVASIKLVIIAHADTMIEAGIKTSYWRASATVGCIIIAIYEILRWIDDIKLLKNKKYRVTLGSLVEEMEDSNL